MPRPFAAGACLLLCSLVIAGCGDAKPEVAPVQGVVRINGKAQPGMMVRFLPDPEAGNDSPIDATGKTDEQGKYVLKHNYEGQEGQGAVVGWHRVLVIDATIPYTQQGQRPPPSKVPLSYASPTTTPLSFEVKPGEQTIDLEVKK